MEKEARLPQYKEEGLKAFQLDLSGKGGTREVEGSKNSIHPHFGNPKMDILTSIQDPSDLLFSELLYFNSLTYSHPIC